jgi:diaminohydroxyphosphoribosylaminopyrimidine deaminase/5-amino-6-(5-phosphoribosylamino)uracil reductase
MNEATAPAPATSAADDERFMALAFALGRRGLGNVWPNPAVGAVIVKDGVIVGRGWTQAGGRPHAEAEALRRAKKDAKGATMYVTLEPCSHQGKTPPCADAILKAGLARVVSALEDPNPEVAGEGHKRLQAKGIKVDIGLGAEEAKRAHAGHITRVTKQRPHVTLKLAISADGKIGAAGRKPVAISDAATRPRVFQMRAMNDAIMVGIGTVLADNPALTARLPGMEGHSPVRVILDATLKVPLMASVVATVRETPTWVFASKKASEIAEDILRQKGCEVIRVSDKNGELDLEEVLAALSEKGITRLLVEGGAKLAANLVAADLVDKAVLIRSQKSIGADGVDALEGAPFTALTDRLAEHASEKLGPDTIDTYTRA